MTITETSWDAVTIARDNGQVAIVHQCEKLSDHRQGRRRCERLQHPCVLLTSNLSSAPQAEADTVNGLRHCRRVALNKTG
jgi:hypothetical protein